MDNPEELLCQVDGADQIVGPCRRGDAHGLGLRHRSVHILVFNAFGDLFLQKRSLTKDVNPGLWDSSAAGHVDFGESYDACAARELHEELNIEAGHAPELLFKLEASEETGWEFIQVYRLQWDAPIDPNPEEISAGAWFSAAEMEGWFSARPEELTRSLHCIWSHFLATRHQAA